MGNDINGYAIVERKIKKAKETGEEVDAKEVYRIAKYNLDKARDTGLQYEN